MTALYYLGIVEGVVHARGEDAFPIKFWHALKMLGDQLNAPKAMGAVPVEPINKESDGYDLPPLTIKALEKHLETQGPLPTPDITNVTAREENTPKSSKPDQMIPSGDISFVAAESNTAPPMKKSSWSPERTEKFRASMAARKAAGLPMGRHKFKSAAESAEIIKSFNHDEYIGKREPEQKLQDSDWPDIHYQLTKYRRSVSQICSDYDVEFKVMRDFIDNHQG